MDFLQVLLGFACAILLLVGFATVMSYSTNTIIATSPIERLNEISNYHHGKRLGLYMLAAGFASGLFCYLIPVPSAPAVKPPPPPTQAQIIESLNKSSPVFQYYPERGAILVELVDRKCGKGSCLMLVQVNKQNTLTKKVKVKNFGAFAHAPQKEKLEWRWKDTNDESAGGIEKGYLIHTIYYQ